MLATTTGWGNTDPRLISQSPKLLEITMRVWSGEQCARAYRHLNIIKADVLALLHQYNGLTPKLEGFLFMDGTKPSKRKLLQLVGTIPVSYKGLTYNIPISVTLRHLYPYNAPLVFVKPTADQQIKVSKHVDASGKIHLPYLDCWSRSSELLILVQICANTFSQQLPVMAKPKLSWANQPPAPLVAKPKQQPQSASQYQPPHLHQTAMPLFTRSKHPPHLGSPTL